MRTGGLVARAAAAVAIFGVAACSFFVDTSADQCSTNADCTARGGHFVGTVCSAQHVCVATAKPSGCKSNADCASSAAPSICRDDGTCVVLTSPDCDSVVGDVTQDGTIVYGFLGPIRGDFASNGIPVKNGLALAFQDFTTNDVGLKSPNGGKPRPIAFVACHDQDDPIRAATHLVDDVRVPAVFGPVFSGDVVKVATQVTIPAGVLLMTASATAPSLTNLPGKNGLVWRTCPSDAIQAQAMAYLVPEVEAQVRAAHSIPTATKITVAMTIKGDAYGTGLAAALEPLLMFNGQSAAANQDLFVPVQYPDPSTTPNIPWDTIVGDVVGAKSGFPSIVILLGTTEAITDVLDGIETAIDGMATPPPRPFYVVSDGGELPELLAAVEGRADLRTRVLGTVPGRHTTPPEIAFAQRYMQTFQMAPGTYADTAYDAGYAVAYATVAALGGPLTGANLSAGLKKLIPPAMIQPPPGPDGINPAMDVLSMGGNIDFQGVSGPLDFDPTTGEAPGDIDIWCISTLMGSGKPAFVSSGAYFDAATSKLAGTPSCP